MSSFFTTPASQRKRKRAEAPSSSGSKKRATSTASRSALKPTPYSRADREDSISGSESSSENDGKGFFTSDAHEESSASEVEDETAAEKRLRIAERYLENIRNEVVDEGGFDAAEIDRDLIAERLKEDVAETKGKIYRHIAADLDFDHATWTSFRADERSITGCALCLPFAYTISKDVVLAKWEIPDPKTYGPGDGVERPTNITPRRKPKRLKWRRGNKSKARDPSFLGHTGEILSIAVSDSGTYVATGDRNARLVIWNADTLTPLRVFAQHRAAVTSLSFRRGTHQLFSASADRTIKIWSVSELAYIETLFGHQDTVMDIAGGLDFSQETCVSVGSRDKTARLWKVVEESQLVFRGGGVAKAKGREHSKARKGVNHDSGENVVDDEDGIPMAYAEGSIDCVALLDASTFVTGSDNGGLSLWSTNKKKPLFTLPLAHGRDPPPHPEDIDAAAGVKPPRLPRWITALTTVPFADLILSASWDGYVRAWRVGPEKRTIQEIGVVGKLEPQVTDSLVTNGDMMPNGVHKSENDHVIVKGIVNGLAVCERGERGRDGLCIVAAVGKEPKLGRWDRNMGRNYCAVFEVPRKKLAVDSLDGDSSKED